VNLFRPNILLSILILLFSSCGQAQQPTNTSKQENVRADTTATESEDIILQKTMKDTISMIGVGDIMLGTTYPAGYLPPNDGKNLLDPVKDILRNADITFGNQEGALFNGVGTPKKCSDPTKCYAFKSPEHYATYLGDAGFDLMSVANNHSGDFGPDARVATMRALSEAGILSSGSLAQPYVILSKDGIRYGLASFSPNTGTPDINNIPEARKIVSMLDSICDIVIVSFHGGAEGRTHQHVTRKTEIFYGEDRGNVYEFAHKMIDAGADVIFGHGPHVTRAIDYYKEKFIIYSMGNFATYGRFNLAGENGIAPIIKIFTDRKGNFIKGEIISIAQLGEGGPVPDNSKAAALKLRELTMADFPEIGLSISNEGIITKK
jgi:poly-gamma-glutamate capsule biosynthesis protein CapA/YwtB (metallophosphatase superfamily)